MSVKQTTKQDEILTGNNWYAKYLSTWDYLLRSYLGGQEYRDGHYLTKYQLETEAEYGQRLAATPLDNHCNSVISVYNSFLFRVPPERDLDTLTDTVESERFLEDADFEGRSLNNFMKDVSTWSSVFGHCWIIMAKPNVDAVTRADELMQEVRPYVNLITPMSMLDWEWNRMPSGKYELNYIRYIEDINGDLHTIKEWTSDFIKTTVIDTVSGETNSTEIADNELGTIPAVIAYNQRSTTRGIGVSDIEDIADGQRYIYNDSSEIEQSIRIDSHPSLVKTPDTQAGIGAGSIIHMEDSLDPGLKPYALEFSGANVNNILNVIQHTVDTIDKMANTGAVRATEARTMSGVAMITEFQLLNAKLSEKGDNLELAEEQIWQLFAQYQGKVWTGNIEYPGSFNIQDTENEIKQLQTATNAASDAGLVTLIDKKLTELLGEDPDTVLSGVNSQTD